MSTDSNIFHTSVRLKCDYTRKETLEFSARTSTTLSASDCSPPGYAPRRLLIIISWSVNWFAELQNVLYSSVVSCSRASQLCSYSRQSIAGVKYAVAKWPLLFRVPVYYFGEFFINRDQRSREALSRQCEIRRYQREREREREKQTDRQTRHSTERGSSCTVLAQRTHSGADSNPQFDGRLRYK